MTGPTSTGPTSTGPTSTGPTSTGLSMPGARGGGSRSVARAGYQLARRAVDHRRNPRPRIRLADRGGRTVYFLTPDWRRPSGGVRVMYRHVDILNEVGIPAAVLHQRPGFRSTWFDHQTRIENVRTTAVGPDDILVLSELDVDRLLDLDPMPRHIVLNQSGHLTWNRSGDRVAEHHLHSKALLGVVVVSAHSAELVSYAYPSLKVRRIWNSVDAATFFPGDEQRAPQICCFPRRGRQELEQVLHLLQGREALRGWSAVMLDGMRQADLAAALRRSRIALALSGQEGFGLPAAEAMACGAYVVGFHGFGGREFFRPEFSAPVESGDIVAVARAVERAVIADGTDPDWCSSRGRAASQFVLTTYTGQCERDSVVSAYRDLIED